MVVDANEQQRYIPISCRIDLRSPRGYFKWTHSWGGVRQATGFSIMVFLRFFSSHVDAQFDESTSHGHSPESILPSHDFMEPLPDLGHGGGAKASLLVPRAMSIVQSRESC